MINLILANLCLAFAITTSKITLQSISPAFFIILRMGIPGFFFLFINMVIYKKISVSGLLSKGSFAIKSLLFMICITSIIPLLLKNFALQNVCSAKFALIGSIDAFVAAFWMFVFFGEKLNAKQFGGVILAFFAILISLLDKSGTGRLIWKISAIDVCLILAVFLSKLGWLISKELVKKKHFFAEELTILNMSGTSIILFLFTFPILDWQTTLNSLMNFKIIVCLISSSFLYFLGYCFFAKCLEKHDFTLIAISGSFIPFLVGIIGSFLGEKQTSFLLIGIIINLIAVKLFTSGSIIKENIIFSNSRFKNETLAGQVQIVKKESL